MPDSYEAREPHEETAQEIFRQISELISERVHEAREKKGPLTTPTSLDEEIKEELRRLREAIQQDEAARAAAIEREVQEREPARASQPPRSEMSEGLRILFGTSRPESDLQPEQVHAEVAEAPIAGQSETRHPAGGPVPQAEEQEPRPKAEEQEPQAEEQEPQAVTEAVPGGATAPEAVELAEATGAAQAVEAPEPADSLYAAEAPLAADKPGATRMPEEVGVSESPYFARFARGLAELPSGLSTGFGQLDELLEGGFDPGLHVITGPPGSGGRAFLLNMLWKTVSEGRHATFYCLATGAQLVWEEMIVTLSHLLDDAPLGRSQLRGQFAAELAGEIRRLDAILVKAFLPYTKLHERLPSGPFPLTRFLSELSGGPAPSSPPALILLDGLPQLLAGLQVTDSLTAGSLLLELDILLRNRGVPGLLLSEGYSGPGGRFEQQGIEHLGSGLLAIRRHRGRRQRLGGGLEEVSLRVLRQPRGLRQGRVSLVLDTASGMLAEAPPRPERQERRPRD